MPYKQRICLICGKEYFPKSATTKYCSKNCSYKMKREQILEWRKNNPELYKKQKNKYNKNRKIKHYNEGKRILEFSKYKCVICGNIFVPNSAIQKYCSKKCYNAQDNKQHKLNRKINVDFFRKYDKHIFYKHHTKTLLRKSKYSKKRRYENPEIKLSCNLRSRLHHILIDKNIEKKYNFIDFVGCSKNFLKKYIENQFSDGMSWDNYGVDGWHVDHIIPLRLANNEKKVFELFHYSNLQPLWAVDNLSKGGKICI